MIRNQKLESIQTISRYLAQTFDKSLNGNTAVELAEVDSWLDFAQVLVNAANANQFNELAVILEACLATRQYLVAGRLTIADISIFASLKCLNQFF